MFEATFTAGDSFSELRSWPAYPASAGWVLKLRLVPRSNAGAVIDLTAAAEGDDHRFTALASVTGGWSAGSYGWAEWVERGAEVYTTATGQAVIAPDPRAASAGSDTRSLAQKTLDDLLSAKAQWDASAGRQRRYKIGEREMEFASESEIVDKIRFWEGRVTLEKVNADLAAGKPRKNRILTRFTRPS